MAVSFPYMLWPDNPKQRRQGPLAWLRCWLWCLTHRNTRVLSRAEMRSAGWDYDQKIGWWRRKHCEACDYEDSLSESMRVQLQGERLTWRPAKRPFFGWRPTHYAAGGSEGGQREYWNVHPEMAREVDI